MMYICSAYGATCWHGRDTELLVVKQRCQREMMRWRRFLSLGDDLRAKKQ